MEALRSGWISGAGPHIEAFESRWAAYCGASMASRVANGTRRAAGRRRLAGPAARRRGDHADVHHHLVRHRRSSWPARSRCWSTPTRRPGRWTSTRSTARITDRTRAIMPVHIYGHPVDMDPLLELADALRPARSSKMPPRRTAPSTAVGVTAASAPRAASASTPTSWSPPAKAAWCWSTTTRWPSARVACAIWAFRPGRRFLHAEIGFNFRLTNLQAALGVTQVERIDAIVARKRAMGQAYTERFSRAGRASELQVEQPWATACTGCTACLCASRTGLDAVEVARGSPPRRRDAALFSWDARAAGVAANAGCFMGEESYPVTERLARQGLYLPSGPGSPSHRSRKSVESPARFWSDLNGFWSGLRRRVRPALPR